MVIHVSRVAALVLAFVSIGCVDYYGPESAAEPVSVVDDHPCGPATARHDVVVRYITFAGQTNGVAEGLNIDDLISVGTEEETCRQGDFVSPEGVEGVDNQFARLLPALDTIAGLDSFQAVIMRAINSGSVMLVLEMQRLDDLENDTCFEMTLSRGGGVPTIGADGLIESGQTLDRNTEIPPLVIENVALQDGVLTAGPVDIEVPFTVDSFEIPLSIRDATIQGTFDENGAMNGIIAGAIVVPEIVAKLAEIDASEDVLRLVSRTLETLADMGRDENGECQQLSVTLKIESVPTFYFRD